MRCIYTPYISLRAGRKGIKNARGDSEMQNLVPGADIPAEAAVVVEPEQALKSELNDALLQVHVVIYVLL